MLFILLISLLLSLLSITVKDPTKDQDQSVDKIGHSNHGTGAGVDHRRKKTDIQIYGRSKGNKREDGNSMKYKVPVSQSNKKSSDALRKETVSSLAKRRSREKIQYSNGRTESSSNSLPDSKSMLLIKEDHTVPVMHQPFENLYDSSTINDSPKKSVHTDPFMPEELYKSSFINSSPKKSVHNDPFMHQPIDDSSSRNSSPIKHVADSPIKIDTSIEEGSLLQDDKSNIIIQSLADSMKSSPVQTLKSVSSKSSPVQTSTFTNPYEALKPIDSTYSLDSATRHNENNLDQKLSSPLSFNNAQSIKGDVESRDRRFSVSNSMNDILDNSINHIHSRSPSKEKLADFDDKLEISDHAGLIENFSPRSNILMIEDVKRNDFPLTPNSIKSQSKKETVDSTVADHKDVAIVANAENNARYSTAKEFISEITSNRGPDIVGEGGCFGCGGIKRKSKKKSIFNFNNKDNY